MSTTGKSVVVRTLCLMVITLSLSVCAPYSGPPTPPQSSREQLVETLKALEWKLPKHMGITIQEQNALREAIRILSEDPECTRVSCG